jgi:carbamoyltransferase
MSDYLLAINDGHDACAALFQGDELIAAASRERFTRKKFHGGFPEEVIDHLLTDHHITLAQIPDIVVCNRHHFVYRLFQRRFFSYTHGYLNLKQKIYSAFHHGLAKWPPLAAISAAVNQRLVNRRLGKRVTLVDHHTAHAASAYFTSGFPEALAVTMDHLGDGYAACVFDCRDGRCRFLYGSTPLHSPGQFYGEITEFLGFNPLKHAGKVTGLAAYGDPEAAYPVMQEFFAFDAAKSGLSMPSMLTRSFKSGLYRALRDLKSEDVAAGLQRRFEEVITDYVRAALEAAGHRRLVLAGGVFGNVRLNQRLMGLDAVSDIFIHPAMNDSGLAAGAGYYHIAATRGLQPREMPSVYLGPSYDGMDLDDLVARSGLAYQKCEHIEEEVAGLLAEGRVVARFRGPMEYGPRALGNRSILVSPTDPAVNRTLNGRLRRTEFMPFAPAIPEPLADRCLSDRKKARLTSRFMNITFDCTAWLKEKAPAVVHVDGTSRPQVVRQADNPSFYALCQKYYEKTGVPAVINTSFNMHEEPMVCSPGDALRAFKEGCADYLALEDFLLAPG